MIRPPWLRKQCVALVVAILIRPPGHRTRCLTVALQVYCLRWLKELLGGKLDQGKVYTLQELRDAGGLRRCSGGGHLPLHECFFLGDQVCGFVPKLLSDPIPLK